MLHFLQITSDILKFSFCYSKKNILPLNSEIFYIYLTTHCGFPDGSVIKNPPAMQETQVRSLGQEDPLEMGMATHSSILAWRIPQTEEHGRLSRVG